jgi:hypothetical protein
VKQILIGQRARKIFWKAANANQKLTSIKASQPLSKEKEDW